MALVDVDAEADVLAEAELLIPGCGLTASLGWVFATPAFSSTSRAIFVASSWRFGMGFGFWERYVSRRVLRVWTLFERQPSVHYRLALGAGNRHTEQAWLGNCSCPLQGISPDHLV